MFDALQGSPPGSPVFITEFVKKHGRDSQAQGIACFCADCKQPVHTYCSEARPERNHFAHYPKTAETPECSSRMGGQDPWRGFLDDSERRQENAVAIRAELAKPNTIEALRTPTNSILRISKASTIDRPTFLRYLERVEDLKLLEHSKIKAWTVPFLVLSVGDFVSGADRIRFHFDKHRGTGAWRLKSARVHPDGSVEHGTDFKVERETLVRLFNRARPQPPGNRGPAQ